MRVASIILVIIGLAVLAGWVFDIQFLKSVLPNAANMQFNTALGILCAGISLWFLRDEEERSRQKLGGQAFALLILLLGSLSLSEYLFGWNLGIDELFVKDSATSSGAFPGRMAQITAISLTLGGLSLLLLGSKLSQYFSLGVLTISLLAVIGYIFDYQALYELPGYGSVAYHTAFSFLILSLGILAARPSLGFMKLLASGAAAGRTARFLLPTTILLIILLGYAVELGGRLRILPSGNESVIFVVLLILVYTPLIYFYLSRIHRAEMEIVRLSRLYATLSQVNQTIVRVKSQQELYESICKVSVEFGQFRLAWIGLFNSETGEVTPVAEHGHGETRLPFTKIYANEAPFDRGITGLAIRSGSPQFSHNIQADPRMAHWHKSSALGDFHSAAALPIRQKGPVIGLLNLYAADIGLFAVKEERGLLEEMAMDISFALDIMQGQTERKRAEEQIQHQMKQLSALRKIDIAISSSFDLQIILNIILEQTLSQLRVDASAILLLDPGLQTLHFAASRGFRSDVIHYTELKIGEGYAGQCMLARKTIHITDFMDTDSKLANALRVENETFVDYYGTPLMAKGEVKGVLEIYHHSRIQADSEWLEFMQALAGQAAIAIDNAQLFVGLQRANAELERRVAERTAQLNQTNIELEHANHAKDEFLANMSHELRTPLNSILGLSESLLEETRGSLNEHQRRSLEIVQSSGHHLLDLITDILDLSKIEAGKLDYYPQPVNVDEICRSSLAFIKAQATKKSITVTYTNLSAVTQISADPRRLKQVLVNLLTNAVKFTPEKGEVALQVNTELAQELIQFSVIDKGIGIAEEDLQKLFQPFVQVDSSLNRNYQGTGLGLALVQKLVDMHGGSIHVESEVGKGSRFIVNLSCRQDDIVEGEDPNLVQVAVMSAEKTNASAEVTAYHGMILLAEDNLANVMTISEYLMSHGYQVTMAHDGLEAIAMTEQVKPDLILMDIQMPAMSGMEAIARLRADPQFTSTPIIALTALAMPGDRERCLAAGANEYMSKPVSLKKLRQMIANML